MSSSATNTIPLTFPSSARTGPAVARSFARRPPGSVASIAFTSPVWPALRTSEKTRCESEGPNTSVYDLPIAFASVVESSRSAFALSDRMRPSMSITTTDDGLNWRSAKLRLTGLR